MKTIIFLNKEWFTSEDKVILSNEYLNIKIFKYPSGIEGLTLENKKGYITLLPYMGQIIWDAKFNGIDLTMKNMFNQPKKAKCIVDTYGCFAFHSGLLSNGCPSPEDTHPMHGEFSCADMDKVWIEINNNEVTIVSEYEYCQGFGYHYIAQPSVTLKADETCFNINMKVKNLTSIEMPLQYMCHMNYAYVENGEISSNIPDSAFKLRETIPAHVKPTKKWIEYNNRIKEETGRSKNDRTDTADGKSTGKRTTGRCTGSQRSDRAVWPVWKEDPWSGADTYDLDSDSTPDPSGTEQWYHDGGKDPDYGSEYDSAVEESDGTGSWRGTCLSGSTGAASGYGYDQRFAQKECGSAESGICGSSERVWAWYRRSGNPAEYQRISDLYPGRSDADPGRRQNETTGSRSGTPEDGRWTEE